MKKINFINSSMLLIKSRKEIVFAVTWTTALSTIIAGKGFPPISKSFISILAIAFLSLSVYIYNDIIDRQMDSHSEQEKKKGRPIAHGKVSLETATLFVRITAVVGLYMCVYLGKTVFAIGASYFILFYLYSYPKVRFKKMYIIKNIVTSLIVPVPFIFGAATIQNVVTTQMWFLTFSYFVLMFLILPAGADWLDYEEDLAFNIKTIGNSFSWKTNIILFNLGMSIFLLLTAIHYMVWATNFIPLLFVAGTGLPLMAYSIKLSSENGLTASYKLRPPGYAYVLITPLFIVLGLLF